MKKYISFIFCFFVLSATMACADDFHRFYRQNPSNYCKAYKFEDLNKIPLKLNIISDVTTKKNLTEGQKLLFLTTEDVVLSHKKVLPAGSRVFGRVETISKNEMMGIPANLIVGNFKIEYMPTIELQGSINKQGANRSIWVKPLAPILFAVRGGHAKIKVQDTYEIYYIPKYL